MTDFNEYIRQTEPDQKEKAYAWSTAIGLQQVDGLKPSEYLLETAKLNIEGDITFDEVKSRIDEYYKTESSKKITDENRTKEADEVSARIAEMLSEKTFSFSPAEYISIHKQLFSGIYPFAGKIREYNITKSEWVLDGETVYYADSDSLKATLEYDLNQEKKFDYKWLNKLQIVEHIANFTANLRQIHIFWEGNTRTTAVFLIKYLRSLGFEATNDLFADNSWYFRNALVRANYNNFQKGVHATNEYLELFFRNLLLGENNVLKNRELHIDFKKLGVNKNTPHKLGVNEGKSLGVKLNKNQTKMLELIDNNGKITIKEMAKSLELSDTAIENNIKKLKEKWVISRVGSDKTGHWEINV